MGQGVALEGILIAECAVEDAELRMKLATTIQ
jgi:hypothetical protein